MRYNPHRLMLGTNCILLPWLMVVLLFPAIAFGQDQENPENVTLQLQWKHQFEFAGFYAAKEKGYYAEAGLEVEIREYEQDKDIIASVLSGEASFGTLYASPILARMEGKPVVLAANYFKRSPLALVVQPDIYFPGDLKGKRVMGEQHELESANFTQMFRQFNMTTEDFTVVAHTFNIDKFINHEVDAMAIFITNEIYQLQQRKVPFNIIDPNNYGVPFYDVTLFTSQSLADSKPETVTTFIEASNKGWTYAMKYPREVVDLILAKYNSQNKTKAHLLFEAEKVQRMVQPDIFPIGSIDPLRIKRIQELLVSEGVGRTIVSPEDFIFGMRKQERLDLTPAEKDFILKHPTIKVIKSFHQPPFTVHEGEAVSGYLYDLLSETLKIAGLTARYVSGGDTYDDMVEAVQKNEADLLPNMNSTRRLSGHVARTLPVVTTPNALVGKITAPKIKSVSDLFGAKVAVVRGYAQDQHLNRFPQIRKVHVSNNNEGFDAVRMGKADYFLNNLANSSYIIQKNFVTDLSISGELAYDVFPPLTLSFAVSRKAPELETIIQKSLAAIPLAIHSGLRKKWLEIDKTYAGDEQVKAGFILSDQERGYLSGKGLIRMCSVPDWPPVEWIDEHGRHQGISAEFMNVIAQRIGHPFELVPAKTWNATMENLKSRKCDFISTTIKTHEHNQYLNMTKKYQELDIVIATRKEHIYIQNLSTLAGQKIGVVKDSVYQTIIEKDHPAIEIVPVDDLYQGLYLVQEGELIGLVDNLISLAFVIQQKGLVDIKISGRVADPIQLCMGIHKDEPMLHQILSRALASISQQQRQEFASKWIAVKFEQRIDYVLLWKVLAATAVIILGIFLWNRRLAAFNQKIVKAKEELELANLVAEKAKAAAQKADRAKSRFLANMSHELRTPLNAILGFSELMKRDPGITPALLNHLETINRSGEHLLSLINDVLELSKIEAGRVVLTPLMFDLHRLLASLEEMFRLRAREKGLALVFHCKRDVPRYIRTDQSKLRQILINLLGNAVKFTPSGKVMLSVRKVEPDAKESCEKCFLGFAVKDTGVGIAEEEKEKIFDAFFQVGKQSASHQGTGLGLSISRMFVELMGGKLKVASRASKGSSFSFTLPVECANGDDEMIVSPFTKRVVTLEAGQPVYRLLVAEDNQNNRSLMVTLLKTVGFEVQEAVDGKQAVEKCTAWKPHLVWMDMRMPIMDGYQATMRIKGSPVGKDTVIIALTASAFEEDRVRVIQHGADDFVRKPFKESEIFDVIQRHLGVRFVYASQEPVLPPAPLHEGCSVDRILAESMASMQADIKQRLKEATELSDTAMIDRIIGEIRTDNEPLAGRLAELADNFAYDKILNLVELKKRGNSGER